MSVRQVADIFTVEGLTSLGPDGRAVPQLAESWAWNEEGLKLSIQLRPGVRFHSGNELTSALVADALRSAIARSSNQALYWSLSDVETIEATSDREINVTVSRPSGALPEDLAIPLRFGAKAEGTGAFRPVSESRDEVTLERFEPYYRGAASIQRVVIRSFDTLRTAWTSLLRGDIDVVTNVPPDVVDFVRNDNVQVLSHLRRYQYLVAFNSRTKPFESALVRRAMNMAVDREQLISRTLNGRGTAATGPLWPQHWAYDGSLPPFAHDQRGAETLFDAAGLRRSSAKGKRANGARFSFTCLLPANFTTLERVGLELQRQLFDVGVDLQFQVVPADEYSRRIREGRFEAVLVDMISGPTFGRPYIFWRSGKRFQGLNVFGYESPEAESLFDVLKQSRDEGTIRLTARRLQRVFLEDPPALFLVWNERTRAISRKFAVTPDPGSDPLSSIWRWNAPQGQQVSRTR